MEGSEIVERRDRPAEKPDEQLLAEFVAGDEEGFTELVRRYAEELFPFLVRYLRDSALAEDVVQESFLQVYQSAGTFDPTRRFRPWLFTIAVNKARDNLRGRGRKREVSLAAPSMGGEDGAGYLDFLSDESAPPQDAMETDECRVRVQAVVSRMPDNLREVLVMAYYHRFAYKDMADILDIPLGTVKSRLHAAVAHFGIAYREAVEDNTTSA